MWELWSASASARGTTMGFPRRQGNQWCRVAGRVPLVGQAFQWQPECQSQAHRPMECSCKLVSAPPDYLLSELVFNLRRTERL